MQFLVVQTLPFTGQISSNTIISITIPFQLDLLSLIHSQALHFRIKPLASVHCLEKSMFIMVKIFRAITTISIPVIILTIWWIYLFFFSPFSVVDETNLMFSFSLELNLQNEIKRKNHWICFCCWLFTWNIYCWYCWVRFWLNVVSVLILLLRSLAALKRFYLYVYISCFWCLASFSMATKTTRTCHWRKQVFVVDERLPNFLFVGLGFYDAWA